MRKTILGIFSERNDAEEAIYDLEATGYKTKDISIIMRDQGEREKLAHNTGANVAEGAVTGATTGGVIGGIAGLLIGIGAIAIPGIGPLLIGGPIASALGLTGAAASTVSGAITGALAGGLVGVLVGIGISEEDARIYEERIREGGILVAVPAQLGMEEEVREILSENGADQIRAIPTYARQKRAEEDKEDLEEYYSGSNKYHGAHTAYSAAGAKGGRAGKKKGWFGEIDEKE